MPHVTPKWPRGINALSALHASAAMGRLQSSDVLTMPTDHLELDDTDVIAPYYQRGSVYRMPKHPTDAKEENPSKSKRKVGRLQVAVPEASIERLERLKVVTEATTTNEVVRRALRIYEGLYDMAERGDGHEDRIFATVGDLNADDLEQGEKGERGRTARLQLLLSEQSIGRLKELKNRTGASSYAEVIRRALRVYDILASLEQNGDGDHEAVVVPLKSAV